MDDLAAHCGEMKKGRRKKERKRMGKRRKGKQMKGRWRSSSPALGHGGRRCCAVLSVEREKK
jgi:hypothetical protein